MKEGYWYAVTRHDGKELGVAQTRHEAVGMIPKAHANKNEWLDIEVINPVQPKTWKPRMTINFEKYPEEYV
jgi:hypothetical protein